MNLWTNEEITKIIRELDERGLPFQKYSFVFENDGLKKLGHGGTADVYEAMDTIFFKKKYVIKVIGFGRKADISQNFKECVDLQKELGGLWENVVKIYDYKELWICFDDSDNIVSIRQEQDKKTSLNVLKLQFIVMEKESPVISRDEKRRVIIRPHKLLSQETEMLKFAYDIGTALQKAHTNNILHRDVKLENVFYSEKEKAYKLGDFGIAKRTVDGFAGTVALTKGYAAPEVRMTDERYDNTADIYSFGMMLYVLANNLKFPDSDTYNVNPYAQYMDGYIVPYPEIQISKQYYDVIAKACMYDPNKRYQSMEEMLLDIQKLMYDENLGYKKEHKVLPLMIGTIWLAIGMITWKITMNPDLKLVLNLWEYLFWTGCLVKGILRIYKKDIPAISAGIFGLGMYILLATGFRWWKCVLVLWMVFSNEIISLYISAFILLLNVLTLFQSFYGQDMHSLVQYRWIALVSISLAVIFMGEYLILEGDDRVYAGIYFKRNFYWNLFTVFYGILWMYDEMVMKVFINSVTINRYEGILGKELYEYILSLNLGKVGMAGFMICLFWKMRTKILKRL